MLRLLTFGGLGLETQEGRPSHLEGQRKSLALLALLAAAGTRGVSRDKLLAFLWPESSDERARGALKQMFHGLRRELDVERLTIGTNELRLNPEEISADATEFDAALAHGDFERAVALYTGAFLDGFYLKDVPEFERWVEEERTRLARRAAGALETLAVRATEQSDHRSAAEWWRRLAGIDPLSSRAALGLMAALFAAGDRAGALQYARSYDRLTHEELGAPPDAAITALADEIRTAVVKPSPPPPTGARPSFVPALQVEDTLEPEADHHPEPASPRRAPGLFYAVAGAVLVLAVYAVLGRPWRAGTDRSPPSAVATIPVGTPPAIAVLPFLDLSPNRDAEYFSDGVSEEVINALTHVEGLHVAARTSSFAFKGGKADIAEIGRRLHVGYVLEGSVRKDHDRLRISAQLISAADGFHLWSETYDRELKDVFDIQEEISRAVVGALEIELGSGVGTRLIRNTTGSMEAYNLYLRGRYHFNAREPQALEQAVRIFEQAIAKDSAFAPAHAALAESLTLLCAHAIVSPRQAMPRARAAALEALALDPELGEAHAALGHIQTWYDWDWAGADVSFRRAIELSPSNASARHWYSVYLAAVGRLDDAVAENERAIELNPVSVLLRTTLGIRLFLVRDYRRALEQFRATLELDPTNGPALVWLGVASAHAGAGDRAIAAADSGFRNASWTMLGAWRAYTYAVAGHHREAREQLRALEHRVDSAYVPPSVIARVYAALDERDSAFSWLERAYEERDGWLGFLTVDPSFDPLRSDPRYRQLIRKIGLETLPTVSRSVDGRSTGAVGG
ncbi:MAG: BTAD domain-containing putative transcriptional regulator [Longimicrobiales bacterium]